MYFLATSYNIVDLLHDNDVNMWNLYTGMHWL